jgi:7-carboxy-7-deazaguanine synthase
MKKDSLKISEIFYSFQGESSLMGVPTLFIRLHGCNLDCRICDTKYSIQNKYKTIGLNEITKMASGLRSPYICITGGEPLLQTRSLNALIKRLLKLKKVISIETNGSLPIKTISKHVKRVLDVKTPSTGFGSSFKKENLKYLTPNDEIKFVISVKKDFDFAQKFVKANSLNKTACTILMSPNLSKKGLANKLVTWILKSKQNYVFQPQLHKLVKEKPIYLIKRA